MRKNGNTTAYRESLRLKILEKAMPLFKRNGVKAVKMDDVANEMGISKRTLYEIYSNKEDLLFECVKHDEDEMSKDISEYARTAENEMDVIAYFFKLKLKDLGSINPCFYTELHKYDKIVDFLQTSNASRRDSSVEFIRKGIEHGFFRDDLNYNIVHKMGDGVMNYVMESKLYKTYSFREIFRTFIEIYMRGCCTEKGLRYLDNFMRCNEM